MQRWTFYKGRQAVDVSSKLRHHCHHLCRMADETTKKISTNCVLFENPMRAIVCPSPSASTALNTVHAHHSICTSRSKRSVSDGSDRRGPNRHHHEWGSLALLVKIDFPKCKHKYGLLLSHTPTVIPTLFPHEARPLEANTSALTAFWLP